jgi:hypothetical protein
MAYIYDDLYRSIHDNKFSVGYMQCDDAEKAYVLFCLEVGANSEYVQDSLDSYCQPCYGFPKEAVMASVLRKAARKVWHDEGLLISPDSAITARIPDIAASIDSGEIC